MRHRRLASFAALSVVLSACGGGGGGGPPPPPPPPVTFTAGTTATPDPISGYTAPFTLEDVAANPIGDDDAIPDLLYAHSGTYSATIQHAELVIPGLGDGTFAGGFGGGGYGEGGPALTEAGDVIGPGLGGGVFALQTASGVDVVTIGEHFSGMSRAGVGGFAPVSGAHLDALAVGDWDGDGTDDVAIADGAGASVETLISDGSTGLEAAVTTTLPLGSDPTSLVALRADGDAFVDLACGDAAGGFHVLRSDGDGSFTLVANPGALGGANRRIELLATGDFDADGKADLGGTITEAGTRRLFTMRGRGDGTFRAPVLTDLPVDARSSPGARIRAADFNLDGITDVAFVVPAAGRLVMFLGDGAGGFSENLDADFTDAGNWDSLSISDLDGDGDVDLLVVDASAFAVRTLLNDAH